MTDTAKIQHVNKIVVSNTKVVDAKNGRVQAIVSAETEDRDGDVIRVKGWELDNFVKHPVLLSSHNYYSLRSVIGEWEDVGAKGKNLIGVAKYYIGVGNDEADWGYFLASQGRAAFSVGFVPKEYEPREEGGYLFTKQELLEISHVSIPSNPDALQQLMKSSITHPELKEYARKLLEDKKEIIEAVRKDGGEMCMCYIPECENDAGISLPLCPKHLAMAVGMGDMGDMGDMTASTVPSKKKIFIVNEEIEENSEDEQEGDVKLNIADLLVEGRTVKFSGTVSPDGEVELEASVVETLEAPVVESEEKIEESVEEEIAAEDIVEKSIEEIEEVEEEVSEEVEEIEEVEKSVTVDEDEDDSAVIKSVENILRESIRLAGSR